MFIAESVTQEVTLYSILALLMPVIVILVRWMISKTGTQEAIRKSEYGDLINKLVETAIDAAEKRSITQMKHNSSDAALTGDEKKQLAVDYVLETAKKTGIPDKLIDAKIVSSLIEAFLMQKDRTT